MVQNKLCLFLSKYGESDEEIEILNFAGIKDINPITYRERGSMREILSHDPENVIVVWRERGCDSDVKSVLINEGYRFVSYEEIRDAVGTIVETQRKFEEKD